MLNRGLVGEYEKEEQNQKNLRSTQANMLNLLSKSKSALYNEAEIDLKKFILSESSKNEFIIARIKTEAEAKYNENISIMNSRCKELVSDEAKKVAEEEKHFKTKLLEIRRQRKYGIKSVIKSIIKVSSAKEDAQFDDLISRLQEYALSAIYSIENRHMLELDLLTLSNMSADQVFEEKERIHRETNDDLAGEINTIARYIAESVNRINKDPAPTVSQITAIRSNLEIPFQNAFEEANKATQVINARMLQAKEVEGKATMTLLRDLCMERIEFEKEVNASIEAQKNKLEQDLIDKCEEIAKQYEQKLLPDKNKHLNMYLKLIENNPCCSTDPEQKKVRNSELSAHSFDAKLNSVVVALSLDLKKSLLTYREILMYARSSGYPDAVGVLCYIFENQTIIVDKAVRDKQFKLSKTHDYHALLLSHNKERLLHRFFPNAELNDPAAPMCYHFELMGYSFNIAINDQYGHSLKGYASQRAYSIDLFGKKITGNGVETIAPPKHAHQIDQKKRGKKNSTHAGNHNLVFRPKQKGNDSKYHVMQSAPESRKQVDRKK